MIFPLDAEDVIPLLHSNWAQSDNANDQCQYAIIQELWLGLLTSLTAALRRHFQA